MTNLQNIGTYGATAQSWRRDNPRPLLEKLMENDAGDPHEKSRRAAIFTAFCEVVKGDGGEEYVDAIIEYWFTNNYNRLLDEKYNQPRTASEIRAARQIRQTEVEKLKNNIKAKATKMVLLDILLPNGKPLRDCTGRDCAKAGGWFIKISEQIPPTAIVGDAFSESQIRKLYGR